MEWAHCPLCGWPVAGREAESLQLFSSYYAVCVCPLHPQWCCRQYCQSNIAVATCALSDLVCPSSCSSRKLSMRPLPISQGGMPCPSAPTTKTTRLGSFEEGVSRVEVDVCSRARTTKPSARFSRR